MSSRGGVGSRGDCAAAKMEGDPGFRSFAERCHPPEPESAANEPGAFIRAMSKSPFDKQEPEIRRYWRADKPFDPMQDGFDRLSALAMLTEIERLRRGS